MVNFDLVIEDVRIQGCLDINGSYIPEIEEVYDTYRIAAQD